MANLDTLDIIVLAVLLLGTVAYFTKGKYWGVTKDPYASSYAAANGNRAAKTRNIVEKMEESNKNCVVFYGSQTGTAEDYASRLAKEGKSRFGLETMVADLEDYDFENLDTFPENKVAVFVLATYGEGEPTDNAVDFYEFITGSDVAFSNSADPPLGNLKFVAFGLGNNTYEHYNSMVRNVTKALEKLGATKIGDAGEGDDGAGTMEEDFLAWKDPMWSALAEKMGLEEREAVYEPVFGITDRETLTKDSPEVYLGEPNKMHLEGASKGPFNAHNPYIAPITESREIFTVKNRNCLHMEIDISGSTLEYQTGDHIAVWPTNSGKEVDRFLNITGLLSKRDNVISVKPLDPTAKVPFPTPTTYDAIVRYHMEICAPVSRQFIATLAPFAPTEAAKTEMARLGSDKDYFHEKISNNYLNIAQALEDISGQEKWPAIPFSAFIEGLTRVQPRYYSISSSSLVQKDKISITAVVESVEIPGRPDLLKGVTTNYLLALKQKQHGDPNPDPHGLTYEITGPRNKYDGVHVPVHVRHSNFKLPSDPSKPIIMEYKEALGDKFELITAFSREGTSKVYVQHRLQERAHEVNELLLQKAYFYVCGDAANMAREVNTVLGKIMSEQRNIPESKAEEIVKSMRSANQYQLHPDDDGEYQQARGCLRRRRVQTDGRNSIASWLRVGLVDGSPSIRHTTSIKLNHQGLHIPTTRTVSITMSYQQTSTTTETTTFPARSPNMYTQSQSRTNRDSQGQLPSYAQVSPTATQNENPSLGNVVNRLAALNLPAAGMAPAAGPAQLSYNPSLFYIDGQIMYAPYSTQPLSLPEPGYSTYQPAVPYFPQAAYSYGPAYHPTIPYTTGGQYYQTDRSEGMHKEVPGLYNRRGSYSTTESTPGTPYYRPFIHGTHIAALDRSPLGSTPSPQQFSHGVHQSSKALPYKMPYKMPTVDDEIDALLDQHPAIPIGIPAPFSGNRSLEQSLEDPTHINRNVYIRGLPPDTNDETLASYAARFGKVESSKAIIDTSNGTCKGFGFAKYFSVRDAERCIHGFFRRKYEVTFAKQSLNARLKAEGDENSTNLYVSNLGETTTESELAAIFLGYDVKSSRILRNDQNQSCRVGFARFETHEICEEVIKKYHGTPAFEEGLFLQIRYADTPAQKDLKRVTTERRQFRAKEYNVAAYGTEALTLGPQPSPTAYPRVNMIAQHLPRPKTGGSWQREASVSSVGSVPTFTRDTNRSAVKVSLTQATPKKTKAFTGSTRTISEDGEGDDGVTVHCDSPVIVHDGSPSTR
ncbi:hypothetical protein B7494_g5745 [Chlorociboria aeruginascens]|nr:hypothetical protein B7494_g5745 [Chlorociboria aeruginascens]